MVRHNPYLGVMFSDDTKWEEHINRMVKKANSTLGFLRRNLRRCPEKLKEIAYVSLVRSILEYASPVWDPHLLKDIRKIEAIQRRAARFVSADFNYGSSVTAMLKRLGWASLQLRRKQARLVTLYKILQGSTIHPAADLLKPASTRTRSHHDQKLCHLTSNTTPYKQSFLPRTVPDWNILPQHVVSSKTVEIFRSRLSENQ